MKLWLFEAGGICSIRLNNTGSSGRRTMAKREGYWDDWMRVGHAGRHR